VSTSQSFYELLKRRRAVRSYTGERVPRETLERIARAARRGPNAGYSQGLRLLVVDDPETIETLAGWQDDGRSQSWFRKAAAHILVLTREQDYHDRYTQPDKLAVTGGVEVTWPVPYWFVDAGALMMLVLEAAIDEGLASAFIGHPDQKRIFDELLGLPEDVVPIGLALVGKPGEAPDIGSRLRERRRPRADLVHWERW
jgi:nitroreductase